MPVSAVITFKPASGTLDPVPIPTLPFALTLNLGTYVSFVASASVAPDDISNVDAIVSWTAI